MNKQSGFTSVELILVIVFFGGIISWIWNIVKLSDCDFEADYRCEVIHGIGVIPAVAPFVVWFDDDSNKRYKE